MPNPKITLYDEPRTMYLLAHREHSWPCKAEDVIGETSRSYVSQHHEWGRRTLYVKKDYRVITEAEYNEIRWGLDNRYKIAKNVEYCRDPAILRRIAVLVGYEEKQNAG